eukprot:TRINITY_DN468_c0_g1_i2.p1 TRINITY_DN468_c0_g1~~TRINITY_DN468_c0_g1_i2.p1  ORF type:complete len:1287 (-),score=353.68 TRINITY_DN468_c0_g1_i2:91-3951(-)
MMATLLLLSLIALGAQAVCPHQKTGLTLWSSRPEWNIAGANVLIPVDTSVLVDVSTPILGRITVNGELIFNNSNIEFNCEWIRVQSGGSFLMGTTEAGCAITNRIFVTFYGDRTTTSTIGTDPFDGVSLGAKGLAVLTNATISVVGLVQGPTWTRLTATVTNGSNIINVKDAVQWKAGDTIVVAGTDYHETINGLTKITNYTQGITWWGGRGTPAQDEVRTIRSVSNGGRTITLETALNFTHWGADYERAEVGLLNRRITFQGDNSSIINGFGGHIMVRKVPLGVFIGAEILRMGQKGVLGRYPIHFHMTKDTFDAGYLIQNMAFRENHQRCITIHYSCGILIDGNVAFNNTGHCYFLEDGSERGNTLSRNLGIKIRPVADNDPLQILPTDSQPAMFWITNPNNTFTDNAAVGGRFGYWFSMPSRPTGPSDMDFLTNDTWVRPRVTPLAKFSNNVAHSCARNGLHVDDMVVQTTLTTELASFSPRFGPYTGTSNSGTGYAEATFENFLVYKCRVYGVWARGGLFNFENLVSLDNMRQYNSPPSPSVLRNSLLVGETDNVGTPLPAELGRSRPDPYNNAAAIKGFETYDNSGSQFAENVRCVNFTSDAIRKAGVFSALECGPFLLQARDAVRNISFDNANHVWVNPCNADCPNSWAIFDQDGSVTGNPQWIVANSSYPSLMVDETCTPRPDWNAWACPPWGGRYLQLFVTINGAINLTDSSYKNIFANTSITHATFYELGTNGERYFASRGRYLSQPAVDYQVMVNVKPRSSYIVYFNYSIPTPPKLTVRMGSALPMDWVYVAIPVPAANLPLTVSLKGTTPILRVDDLSQVTSKWNYYYSQTDELVYVRLDATSESIDNSAKVFTNVNGDDGWSVTIESACNGGCRVATKPASIPAKNFPAISEDSFVANLQYCQSAVNKQNTPGGGFAFVRYNRLNNTLHYSLTHDQMYKVNEIALKRGVVGTVGTTLHVMPYTDNPVQYFIKNVPRSTLLSLLKGELYISVSTASQQEVLRGQIGCEGTCNLPRPIFSGDACTADAFGTNSFSIYTDFDKSTRYTSYAYTPPAQIPYMNTTQNLQSDQALCGNTSIAMNICPSGNAIIGLNNNNTKPVIDTSVYKYLQFFARVSDGQVSSFQIFVHNGSANIANIPLASRYIDTDAIEDKWTRVKIPLSDLNFGSKQTVNYIGWSRTDWNTRNYSIVLYVDEVRFIGEFAAKTGVPDIATKDIYMNKDLCLIDSNKSDTTRKSVVTSATSATSASTDSSIILEEASASVVQMGFIAILFTFLFM